MAVAAQLHDVAIVGGGPAGLALAIECAQRGLSTVVLEKRPLPCDKACGEGLMPAGARSLERLGVRALLSDEDCTAFEGIRYVQEDGTTATARLVGGGLGVRRLALSEAMARRARAAGASVREGTALRGHARTRSGFQLATDAGSFEARLLVAADGLSSALRRSEGLERVVSGPRRFGMRRHFRCAPWSSFVEVHFAEHAEAYVTPVGRRRVGIAFLWEDGRVPAPISYPALLGKFPALLERLRGVESDSEVSGAGPFERAARAQVADQFVLFGDAAGYLDALTGEGLSLAFRCAEVLAEALPGALAAGAARGALLPYQRVYRRAFRKYAWVTRGMLMIVRWPPLRRRVVRWLGAHQGLFERLVRWAT